MSSLLKSLTYMNDQATHKSSGKNKSQPSLWRVELLEICYISSKSVHGNITYNRSVCILIVWVEKNQTCQMRQNFELYKILYKRQLLLVQERNIQYCTVTLHQHNMFRSLSVWFTSRFLYGNAQTVVHIYLFPYFSTQLIQK